MRVVSKTGVMPPPPASHVQLFPCRSDTGLECRLLSLAHSKYNVVSVQSHSLGGWVGQKQTLRLQDKNAKQCVPCTLSSCCTITDAFPPFRIMSGDYIHDACDDPHPCPDHVAS